MTCTIQEFVDILVEDLGEFANDISAIQLIAKDTFGSKLDEVLVYYIRDLVCRELYRRNGDA